MISIGAVYHGPELNGSEVNRLIMRASKALKDHGASPAHGKPWVNAVFVVSGSLGHADFQNLEFGDYSRKKSGVVVKIPISVRTTQKEGLARFIVDSLHGVNAMAFEFFRQKGENFPLREAEEAVAAVSKQLISR